MTKKKETKRKSSYYKTDNIHLLNWPALNAVPHHIVADPNWNNNIETFVPSEVLRLFPNEDITKGYSSNNPFPGENTVLYNPNDSSVVDDTITLDGLHYMHTNTAYEDLYNDVYNAVRKEPEALYLSIFDLTWNDKEARDITTRILNNDTISPEDLEVSRAAVDGYLRRLFAPDYMRNIERGYNNKYPMTGELERSTNTLREFMESNILPEIIITPDKKANGGFLDNNQVSWNKLSMKEKHLYIKQGVANGLRDINSIREYYNNSAKELTIDDNNYTGYALGGVINQDNPILNYSVVKENIPAVRYDTGGPKRQHPNTSPTALESTMLENTVAKWIRNDLDINHAYDIPYIPERVMTINGYDVSTNALDSIAKYAGITNTPLDEAIALSFESGYGRLPYFNYGSKDYSDRAIGNMNYHKNFETLPSHLFVRDYEYTKGGYNNGLPYTDKAPLEHALEFYQSGRYNPALRVKENGKVLNHTLKVKSEAKKLAKDKNYLTWKELYGNKEYSGETQKQRDKVNAHNKYKEDHPIKAWVKDLLGIEYANGGNTENLFLNNIYKGHIGLSHI